MSPFFHSIPMLGTIILMVLKIGGYIDAPWILIFAPIFFPFLLLGVILLVVGTFYIIFTLIGALR